MVWAHLVRWCSFIMCTATARHPVTAAYPCPRERRSEALIGESVSVHTASMQLLKYPGLGTV